MNLTASGGNRNRWRAILISLGLATLAAVFIFLSGPTEQAEAKYKVTVYPSPGTPVASDTTTFSFRGIKKRNMGPVVAVGSRSGRHRGRLRGHPDGRGVTFIPRGRFARGEMVTVRTRRNIRHGRNGVFRVRIGRFYGSDESGRPAPAKPVKGRLHSRPDLAPPVLRVKKLSPGATMGKIFFAPEAEGMAIADRTGRIVWARPVGYGGTGTTVFNFRPQKFHQRPVLTYWKGASTITGYAQVGWYEILNSRYRRIARFKPANGYQPDIHDFVITGRNTALVLAYRGVTWDTRKFGGVKSGRVVDNIVQEIDIRTGDVYFEWHSVGKISVGASQAKVPKDRSSFDYFHVNSARLDGPDALLISGRKTSTVYRISRKTGNVWWALRGSGRKARSDFRMTKGTRFAYQHDAIRLPNGAISLFDNGSGRFAPTVNKQSSGLVLRLHGKTRKDRKATLIRRNTHRPKPIVSGSQGNAQWLPRYGMFIGWGSVSAMTEYSPSGRIVFDADFPKAAVSSYRAYKKPWHGHPVRRPAIASKRSSGTGGTVWASWNGASNVATWRVITTSGNRKFRILATAPWKNLETKIRVDQPFSRKVAVQALDRSGKTLRTSAVVKVGRRSR